MAFVSRFVSGLRFRLLLLVLLTCTPLVVLTLRSASEDRRRERADWQKRAQNVAEQAAREEEKIIADTRQLLVAMGESDPMRTGNQQRVQHMLEELFGGYPRYSNLGVLKTNGEALASAIPVRSPQKEQKYFKRAMETLGFAVGEFHAGGTYVRPVVDFGLAVLNRSRQVQAVIFATLDLEWHQRFGSEVPSQLPPKAAWYQVAPDGAILVRYPGNAPGPSLGQKFGSPALIKQVFANPSGVEEIKDADGVDQVYAYAQMVSHFFPGQVAAVMAIPRQQLFASSDRTLRRNLGWLAFAAGCAALVGWLGSKWLVLQPVKAVARSSARLAEGDLSARTGVTHSRDELGQLAGAFDSMANTLQQREIERVRANRKLQVLSRRLVEVQEAERRRIARELHDEVGQSLTAAQINVQAALASSANPATETRLNICADMIQRVLEQVQDLSLSLRPSMLDDLGLIPALRWLSGRQEEVTGIQTEFIAELPDRRLDTVIETECFRVAQEALTNVARHAKARSARIRLEANGERLLLSVVDDGVGFDVASVRDQAVRGNSLGVLSMEERASLAGGQLELESTPGTGTRVKAWFPLRWRNEQVSL